MVLHCAATSAKDCSVVVARPAGPLKGASGEALPVAGAALLVMKESLGAEPCRKACIKLVQQLQEDKVRAALASATDAGGLVQQLSASLKLPLSM
jgi:hypothetical protein